MNLDFIKSLGMNSESIAVETECALGIRFSEFTPEQCDLWRAQTLCLKQYALTPNYQRAAQRAGVAVSTIEEWERDNVLGFVKRKEVAELRFSDMVQVILQEMAKKPDAPPLLLSWVLNMHMPEKYDVLTPEDMVYDPPGPTEAEIRQQVVEEYRRIVRERERLLDEEQRLLASPADDSIATADTLSAGHLDDRRAPEDKQFEPVRNWSLDGSVRTKNN